MEEKCWKGELGSGSLLNNRTSTIREEDPQQGAGEYLDCSKGRGEGSGRTIKNLREIHNNN